MAKTRKVKFQFDERSLVSLERLREQGAFVMSDSSDCYLLKMQHRGWFRHAEIKEADWYWWWDEDPDAMPVPVNIMYSPTDEKFFASVGQLGWNRTQNCEDMGGWWQRLIAPQVTRPC